MVISIEHRNIRALVPYPLVGGGLTVIPPAAVVESSKYLFEVPPVVKLSGMEDGLTVKVIS